MANQIRKLKTTPRTIDTKFDLNHTRAERFFILSKDKNKI